MEWNIQTFASNKNLWLWALLTTLFFTMLTAFDGFCSRPPKASNLSPKNYARNLVLGTVSSTKSELTANSALWTSPLDRSTSFTGFSRLIESRQRGPIAVHSFKKSNVNECTENRKREIKISIEAQPSNGRGNDFNKFESNEHSIN